MLGARRSPVTVLGALVDLRGTVVLAGALARPAPPATDGPGDDVAGKRARLRDLAAAREQLDAIEAAATVAVARALGRTGGDVVGAVMRRVRDARAGVREVRAEVADVLRAAGPRVRALEELDATLSEVTGARRDAALATVIERAARDLDPADAPGAARPRSAREARARVRDAARDLVRHERRLVDALLAVAEAHLSIDTEG